MQTDSRVFFSWFEQPIRALQATPGCQIGLVILCFPLLERYIRQSSGCHEGDLTDKFYDDLCVVFPELVTRDIAKRFWHVYRNGLLHQGAFSAAKKNGTIMSYAAISGETPRLAYDSAVDAFYVNPLDFSNAVLDFIRDDLTTLEAASATNHEIPSVGIPATLPGSTLTLSTPATGNFVSC